MQRTKAGPLPGLALVAGLLLPAGAHSADAAHGAPGNTLLAQAGEPGRAGAGAGERTGKAALGEVDRKFIRDAAMGNLLEIRLGQIADNRAESPQVRAFAQRMVQDHGNANAQLLQVVAPMGVELPVVLEGEDEKKAERLQQLEGRAFDQAYAQKMVEAHEKSVETYRERAGAEGSPQLKEFAATQLPVVQEHLSMAREMERGTGGQAGPAGGTGARGADGGTSDVRGPVRDAGAGSAARETRGGSGGATRSSGEPGAGGRTGSTGAGTVDEPGTGTGTGTGAGTGTGTGAGAGSGAGSGAAGGTGAGTGGAR